jgi:hypothetical protein
MPRLILKKYTHTIPKLLINSHIIINDTEYTLNLNEFHYKHYFIFAFNALLLLLLVGQSNQLSLKYYVNLVSLCSLYKYTPIIINLKNEKRGK